MKWMSQGDCAGWDFTTEDPWHDPEHEPLAKAICHDCPVRDRCATYAVINGMWTGIWGGMTVEERSRWAKRHGLARHGTLTGYTKDSCRCVLCQTAIREYDQEKRPRKGRCGTPGGAQRHRRAGEALCGPCLEAERAYRRKKQRQYRAA